jgi:branched-chain amino acid transport system permease protein
MNLIIQLLINGIVNASLYCLLSTGFGIVYRSTRIFHIAYAGIYTLSAYFLYVFYNILKMQLIPSVLISLFLTGLFGIAMEKGIYFQFYKRRASSTAILIGSMGIYIIIENLIALLFGNEVKIIYPGIQPSYSFRGIVLTRIEVIELITGFCLSFLFFIFLKKTRIMKALWAMGEEEELVNALGLPLSKLRVLVFLLSSIFAGVASILKAIDVGMDPHIGMKALLTGMVAIIVGGIDSYPGWITGGILIAELESLVIWKASASWSPLITFVLLIIILLTRPQGIFGLKRRLEEI